MKPKFYSLLIALAGLAGIRQAAAQGTAFTYQGHLQNNGNPATGHIGPVAQDFHAAFGMNGTNDTTISTVDEGGVGLAAIQGLDQKLEEQTREKDAEIQKLEKKLDALQTMVNQLVAQK